MEGEREIAEPGFTKQHPELHHYTDLNGLRGIITSNSVWATHFAHLNDKTEMLLLREPMIKELSHRVAEQLKSSFGNRHARRAATRQRYVNEEVGKFVDSMFKAAFEKNPFVEPLAETYLTSLCSHYPDQIYETKNGLLSQWRAYGKNEKYCIVFDSNKIIRLLEREFEFHPWTYLRLSIVYYYTEDITIGSCFPELMNRCANHLVEAFQGRQLNITKDTIIAFLSSAPRLKHRGFREEQEVRIIAIPYPQSLTRKARLELGVDDRRPEKLIQHRGEGGDIPYVALFDSLSQRLPIKRVIVGPSKVQSDDLKSARQIIQAKYPIHCSETPFVG